MRRKPGRNNWCAISKRCYLRTIDPERIVLEPDPLTCSAHIRLQADTVTQADGMPSETPASPPALSQRERVRTAAREIKPFPGRINRPCAAPENKSNFQAHISA